MTKWTKGDPKPENWPEWLKKADISWCYVEIGPVGYVNWLNRVWESGTWENGSWVNGNWVNGTWRSGNWENGTWFGGSWLDGFWISGVWYNGTWENGTWKSGTWLNGTWYGGIWVTGAWHNGTWVDGTWESGHQRKPRFAWSLDPDGLIRGFDGSTWKAQTAEEWQPLLEGMPKLKALEFNLIKTWQIEQQFQTTALLETSIWDHLSLVDDL